jgi:hypothetical protein
MNNPFIAYDISSLPGFIKGGKKITLPEILVLKDETGYLFYDSKKGNKPEVLNGDIEVKIVDYNVPKWKNKLRLIIRLLNKKLIIQKLKGVC